MAWLFAAKRRPISLLQPLGDCFGRFSLKLSPYVHQFIYIRAICPNFGLRFTMYTIPLSLWSVHITVLFFESVLILGLLFPTCQVRVVRFYVSCLLLSSSPLLLLLLNRDPRRTVFSVGPQPRPSTPSVPCRTSFPAGPQPRPSTPSVPCRTSTASIHAKCSLPDLM